MSADNWKSSLVCILKEEGGNDDDPRDPGGRTSRGVIQREWNVYRKTHPGLPSDVWQAPQEAIEDIYKTQYWEPYCDKLPAGVDLCFFNCSVNSGRTQAVRELQRAVGVFVDGMMGMITLNAVNSHPDIKALIIALCDQRRAFYRALKTFPVFGRGWLARTSRIQAAALEMASRVLVRYPVVNTLPHDPSVTVSAKARPSDAAEPPVSPQTATMVTVASSATSGISDQLQATSAALQPLSDTFYWIKVACIGIAVVCAGLAIYAIIQKNKQAAVL